MQQQGKLRSAFSSFFGPTPIVFLQIAPVTNIGPTASMTLTQLTVKFSQRSLLISEFQSIPDLILKSVFLLIITSIKSVI